MVRKAWRPREGHKVREVGQRCRPRCRPRCRRLRRAVRLVRLPVLNLAPAPAVRGGLANRAGLELDAVGARVVGGAAVGAHVGRHDGRSAAPRWPSTIRSPHLLMSLCHSPADWPVGVNPSAGGPGNSIAQGCSQMVVGHGHHHHATSLTLAQPNFHYPIPTSFELTQRGPTDWVCGATNQYQNICPYRGDSNLAKVQLNINSKALVAHIDSVV